MKTWIPITAEALPLPGADPDPYSEGYHIKFQQSLFGRVKANVYDEDRVLVDSLEENSFQEAYDRVRDLYPQASWRGLAWHNPRRT